MYRCHDGSVAGNVANFIDFLKCLMGKTKLNHLLGKLVFVLH